MILRGDESMVHEISSQVFAIEREILKHILDSS